MPGPNRFLVIMAFLLVILYITYRNMKEREEGQNELKQQLDSLRETVEQKDIRIQEIHHRIKNNLQILSSLFAADAQRAEEINWKERLDQYKARVNSIAMVHNVLNESGKQEFLKLKPYLERVVHRSRQLLSDLTSGVEVNTDIDRMTVDRRMATTCGLLTNELMTNCYQHAFDNGEGARINIVLSRVNGHVKFVVEDNGSGGTKSMFEEESDAQGSDIVSSLVESHLKGDIELEPSEEGTKVQITFPAVYGSTNN